MRLRDERRNVGWKVDWLMFTVDTVLLGDSEEKLEKLELGSVCQRRKLSVNETKSKIYENRNEWRREWVEEQFA